MKKLVLILAVLNLVGCSESPKQVAAPAQRAVGLPVASVATHWKHSAQFVETYDQCVRDGDGRILVEVMHATQEPTDPYGVYENGAGFGKYDSLNAAKARAVQMHPECAVQAGAQPATPGKPDSEKPEKKSGEFTADRNKACCTLY